MTFVFITVFVSYALLVAALHAGWMKAIKSKIGSENRDKFVTVIVPVRNEEGDIGFLLDDLFSQDYPRNKVEIIVVNDHSEDKTGIIVEGKIKELSFFNCKIIEATGHGKKSAIATGVQQAIGELIVTIDADCRTGVSWLHSINACFDNTTKMLFGPVKIEQRGSLFSKMQSIEFASLIGSGAATMAFGIPTMCNGANLAFRKEVFHEVRGYEGNTQIASGDDEFLMRKIAKKYPKGIRFNNSQASIVTTKPQQTLSHFISQRIRWAGKWKHHGDFKSKFLAVYIFTFHGMVLSAPILFLTQYMSGYVLLSLLILKSTLEFIFLRSVTSWLNIRCHWPSFILLQVLYSLYVVLTGFSSLFVQTDWKGRK